MDNTDEPIHHWFELSYSNYLVLPRSVLQSAPVEWQRSFVALLNQLSEMFDQPVNSYRVLAIDPDTKRFVSDPLADYDRGRRIVSMKESSYE